MDELTGSIQDDVPWCMLFADDIVLIDETSVGVNQKLELWRKTLEDKGFKLSRSKTEYMHCDFSQAKKQEQEVKLDGVLVSSTKQFKYLGSVFHNEGRVDEDVAHRIQVGWMKWKGASGVLCDKNMPLKLKGKFYRTVVRPAMLYGSECWAPTGQHIHKMSVAEMRMLRWMCGHTRLDKIKNEHIRQKVRVAEIGDKVREGRLRWYDHVLRRSPQAAVRQCENLSVEGTKRGRGRPKIIWKEVVARDLRDLDINPDLVHNRLEWKRKIHVVENI
jgi:hypothetical protein